MDGLLSAHYGARYPIQLSVSPLLAGIAAGENDRLADKLLYDRARQVMILLRNNIVLNVRVQEAEARAASDAERRLTDALAAGQAQPAPPEPAAEAAAPRQAPPESEPPPRRQEPIANPAAHQIVGRVEEPGSVPDVVIDGLVRVSGWASSRAGGTRIDTFVDGEPRGEIVYGLPKPEVAALYPELPEGVDCGFAGEVPVGDLPDGWYTLGIRISSVDGNRADLSTRFEIDHDAYETGRLLGRLEAPTKGFQRYLAASHARATIALAQASGEAGGAVSVDAARAPALELYLPVPAHRAAWTGDERILVATTADEREGPVAFSPSGERLVLDRNAPPDIPVLALVPAETDFDGVGQVADFLGEGGGASTPPAGLYMTNSHLVETFESWVKGAPEIEVHMLGQAGATDSLTTYSCAAQPAAGYYYFDQNSQDWSGSVLLMTQTSLTNYRKAHANQNLRVFLVEDDDTPCQIKVEPARFANLIKAVEAAYPLLTGGRDSTNGDAQDLQEGQRDSADPQGPGVCPQDQR